MKRVCILTTRHISYNPRVLKEADALDAGGYDVTVVTINNSMDQRRFDEEIMQTRKWRLKTVNFRKEKGGERRRWVYLSVKQRFFILLSRMTLRSGIAERAAEKAYDGLRNLATKEKADFYLVHHAEALGAGYYAARHNKAVFGFDAEDFHTGMSESASPNESAGSNESTGPNKSAGPGAGSGKSAGPMPSDRITEYLERKFLPHCRYMTAASKGIAAAYSDKYKIDRPGVILNVFPTEDLPVRPPGSTVKFYWYSQVIGPNRGLELLMAAAGQVVATKGQLVDTAGQPGRTPVPFEIHLRGQLQSEKFGAALRALADEAGIGSSLFIHPPILADQLIRDGNNFDVGLALELPVSINRNICVTNKVFAYLMARLAIIGTDTDGQKDIFSHFPQAVSICRADDAEDLAAAMRSYLTGSDKLTGGDQLTGGGKLLQAKQAASDAAEKYFNWETESGKLLQGVNQLLNSKDQRPGNWHENI